MIELKDDDFLSLNDFALRWRFSDAQYGQVSPELLHRVRPLTANAATELLNATAKLAAGVHTPVIFDAASDHEGVRLWLRSLPPAPEAEVLVSWDAETAAITDWAVFTAHWDDFCYPSSDDVSVCPPGGAWLLRYHHFERLEFWSAPRAA